MLDAMRLPVKPRPFGAQAGLLGIAQDAVAVVQRGLSQSGHGGAELCDGLAIRFEQTGVFVAQGAVQGHFFRPVRRARGECRTEEKHLQRKRVARIPGKIDNTEWP